MIGESMCSLGTISREGIERPSGFTRTGAMLCGDEWGCWAFAGSLFLPPPPHPAVMAMISATAATPKA